MTLFKCPVCRARFRGGSSCKRCGADLTPLIRIVNRAVSYYNQALAEAGRNAWESALESVDSALIWHKRDEFINLRAVVMERISSK